MTDDPAEVWSAAIGDSTVPTPFLALSARLLEANAARGADAVSSRSSRLAPHLKTHKAIPIAELQRSLGSRMATAATIAEVELGIRAGFEEILLAYPPVPEWRAVEVARLSRQVQLNVTCSSAAHVASLKRAGAQVGIFWEVECGANRLGTPSGPATVDQLLDLDWGREIPLVGLLTFAGHAYATSTAKELEAVRRRQDDALITSRALAAAAGFGRLRISAGVTPLLPTDELRDCDYRYGNYVFHDATQVALGIVQVDQCALTVITSIIDVPDANTVVIDAGSKALPAETMSGLTQGFGQILGRPDLHLTRLFEEHGVITCIESHGLALGSRLAVVPNHACTCVNLHESYRVIGSEGEVMDRWPIEAKR